ncbi:uncharacterized protein LOC126983273 [Eriocheir sinensis]|uniref:uncharacterized protein LOC126983273 n=1 Tax=Eriocheir sinensis TaxID=95602 RepID=UPI0021C6DD56|nr:uncharacterized protein LOC126983273 [Eriocheir sinensis]
MLLSLSVLLACAAVTLGSASQPQASYGPPQTHGYCDPTAPPACVQGRPLPFCTEDDEYPEYEIKAAISADKLFGKKYADVADQSADDLVEYVTKSQEEAFDFSYYTGVSTGYSPYDVTHWTGPEGYICPSKVGYRLLRRARNLEGKWHVIVNDVEYYTQTTRLDHCLFPQAACRALAPCFKSKCVQKYVYHRLLSFDPCDPYKGLFIDIYKLPSACSCHIPTH